MFSPHQEGFLIRRLANKQFVEMFSESEIRNIDKAERTLLWKKENNKHFQLFRVHPSIFDKSNKLITNQKQSKKGKKCIYLFAFQHPLKSTFYTSCLKDDEKKVKMRHLSDIAYFQMLKHLKEGF